MSGQRTQWNEATRVQMPALVHLTRIGFTYFGKITEDKAGTVYDPDTNILIEVFKSQFAKLNPERVGEADAMLRTIRQELDNDDIGESFYMTEWEKAQNGYLYDVNYDKEIVAARTRCVDLCFFRFGGMSHRRSSIFPWRAMT